MMCMCMCMCTCMCMCMEDEEQITENENGEEARDAPRPKRAPRVHVYTRALHMCMSMGGLASCALHVHTRVCILSCACTHA